MLSKASLPLGFLFKVLGETRDQARNTHIPHINKAPGKTYFPQSRLCPLGQPTRPSCCRRAPPPTPSLSPQALPLKRFPSSASPAAQLVKSLRLGRPGLDPWAGKSPWRRERLPTPVCWPEEFHELYSPWGPKELDMSE